MNYLADSTLNCARVGRVGMLAGRVFQWDNSSGEKCEPVIVFLFLISLYTARPSFEYYRQVYFESLDLSVCQGLRSVCVVMLWCFEQGNLMQG